jgi:hypothetical protein
LILLEAESELVQSITLFLNKLYLSDEGLAQVRPLRKQINLKKMVLKQQQNQLHPLLVLGLSTFRAHTCPTGHYAHWLHSLCLVNFLQVLQIQQRLSRSDLDSATASHQKQRVHIASILWNNKAILQNHWNDAVVVIAKNLGPGNMFIGIYESGSCDNGKNALRD